MKKLTAIISSGLIFMMLSGCVIVGSPPHQGPRPAPDRGARKERPAPDTGRRDKAPDRQPGGQPGGGGDPAAPGGRR